jgi:hypothetical protein
MRAAEQRLTWTSCDDATSEVLTVGFENKGWTAEGKIAGPNISYVLRYNNVWRTRQFFLFRDMEEPDLWLVTDGEHWNEMNGASREDLDGCIDIGLTCSPFPVAASIKRLLSSGKTEETFTIAMVDVETLSITPHTLTVHRAAEKHWSCTSQTSGDIYQVFFDDLDMPTDIPGRFRRT